MVNRHQPRSIENCDGIKRWHRKDLGFADEVGNGGGAMKALLFWLSAALSAHASHHAPRASCDRAVAGVSLPDAVITSLPDTVARDLAALWEQIHQLKLLTAPAA